MNKVKDITNFKPTVFWAWNGDMLDDEIIRSIKSFSDAGIGGLHLHARAGLTIDYLGEEWMRAYKTTLRECKKYGIDVWIYDEQGWPSGFAGGKVCALGEDYYVKYLSSSNTLDGIPYNRVLAAYKDKGGKYNRVEINENADLYVYYSVQEHYVDLLNPAVSDAFIENTHEVYKKAFSSEFGKTIKGVFTDEPQIHVTSRAWSVAIPEAYQNRYSEDVLDNLYLLFLEEGEEYQEFRYKYYNVVRELFLTNYTEKIYKWCDANGLIFTGHIAGEEGLCVQVASNTGGMPHYEYFHRPGIDHLGRKNNAVLLLKQVQSVASQFSQKRILCETFACTGNGVSFKDLAWVWNYLNTFGANCPCMSISMYSLGGIRKRDYPVFLSEQQPWWEEFSNFNKFLNNSCEFQAEGEYDADVLLISAINSALCEPIFSLKQKLVSASYRRLVEDLVDLQIPYEIGDERILSRHAKIEGNMVVVGNSKYSKIVIPEMNNVTSQTLNLICEFVKNGGEAVCFTKYPERVDGKLCDTAKNALSELGVAIVQQRRGIIEKYFRNIQYKRRVYITDLAGKLSTKLYVTYKKTDNGMNVVVMNPSTDAEKQIWLKTCEKGGFYNVDVTTMNEEKLHCVKFGDEIATKLTLKPKQCIRLRLKEEDGQKVNETEIVGLNVLPLKLVSLGENTMTIDKAVYRLADRELSKPMPLVWASNLIYKEIEEFESEVPLTLKYTFKCESVPEKLEFAGETSKAKNIMVNGETIDCFTEKRFLDRDFWLYDISKYVKQGENVIEIQYKIEPMRLGFDLESVHDAVRNKFSYPVAIESIYLKGNFMVKSETEIVDEPNHLRTDGEFVIASNDKKEIVGDITSNGYFFYPYNAVYQSEINYSGGRAFINFEYDGTAVAIEVNGEKVAVDYLAGEDKEITKYLKEGKNSLKLTLFGSIRNLLGPHHHTKGEPEYTGVHTFTGEYGNGAVEDLCAEETPNNVWCDGYSFTRLGIYKAKIIYKN